MGDTVTWVRTEDDMPLHPKLLKLSDGAYRLWSNSLHFANRAVTDGLIDKGLVATLNHHGRWTPKQLASFVQELLAGLWLDAGDHYEIHDYAHHQAEAMKERVGRKRDYERDKKRRQRETREGVPTNVPMGTPEGSTTGNLGPVPSRPVPCSSNTNTERVPGGSAGPRSERLRLGWRTRFVAENPQIKPPAETNPMSNGPWLEVARGIGDEQVDVLLDAYFADDFCRQGFYLRCLVSERIRLLTHGPKVNGEVKRPESTRTLSPLEADFLRAQQAAQRALQGGADAQTQLDLDQAEEAARQALALSRRKAS